MNTIDKDTYKILRASMRCISYYSIYLKSGSFDYRLYYNEVTNEFYETSFTTHQAYKRYGINPYRKLNKQALLEVNNWHGQNIASRLLEILDMMTFHRRCC